MPTYEYKCLKCKKKFDHFQKMSDKPLAKCVHCGGKVERLIGSGAGIIFKGSGFYATDYKKKVEGGRSKVEGEKTKVEGGRSKVEGEKTKVEGESKKPEKPKEKQ